MYKNVIRYLVLAFGIEAMLYMDLRTKDPYGTDLLFTALFILWGILPHLVYFISSWKIQSKIILTIPAVALCSLQVYFAYNYFQDHTFLRGLVFIYAPICELVAIPTGFLVGVILRDLLNGLKKKPLIE
jgi:hypothetical protein